MRLRVLIKRPSRVPAVILTVTAALFVFSVDLAPQRCAATGSVRLRFLPQAAAKSFLSRMARRFKRTARKVHSTVKRTATRTVGAVVNKLPGGLRAFSLGGCRIAPRVSDLARPAAIFRTIQGCVGKVLNRVSQSVAAPLRKIAPGGFQLKPPAACNLKVGIGDLRNPGGVVNRFIGCASNFAKGLGGTIQRTISALANKALGPIQKTALPALTQIIQQASAKLGKTSKAFQDGVAKALLQKITELADQAVGRVIGGKPQDLGQRLAGSVRKIPVIGGKVAPVIQKAYDKGYGLLRNTIAGGLFATAAGAIDKVLGKVTGGGAAALQQILKLIGVSAKLAKEAKSKIKGAVACITRGVAKKKGQMMGMLKDLFSNPGKVLLGLFGKGINLVKTKIPVLFSTFAKLLASPKVLITSMPKELMTAKTIDPNLYKNLVYEQIPRMIGESLRRLVTTVPDVVAEGFEKLVGNEFPFNCLAPIAKGLIKMHRGAINGVLGVAVNELPKLWRSTFAKQLDKAIGYAMHFAAEVLATTDTFSRIRELVNEFYFEKIDSLNDMVAKARQLLQNPTPQARKEAMKLADRMRNEVPFLSMEFWVKLVRGPLKQKILGVVNNVIEESNLLALKLMGTLENLLQGVVDLIGEIIPYVSAESTTIVTTITKVLKVVINVLKFLQMVSNIGILVRGAIGLVLGKVLDVTFDLMQKGAGKADALLAGMRTRRDLPLPGPMAVLGAGIQNLYNKFVRPYLGNVQAHVAFISDLVYQLAGKATCSAATGGQK